MEFYFSGTVKSYTDAILFDQLESRFVYRDGMYSSLPEFHENITNSLVSGRAISETEENNGERVAVIYYNRAESDPLIIEYNNDKMFISFLGIRYWVIGEHNMGMGGLPVVPFLSVPDDFLYDGTVILTPKSVITRSQYQTMIHTAEMTIPNAITFPNLKLPDSDSVTISNNMMAASLLIAVLCSLNFTMLYQYIMDKRRKTLAVFRLAGCSKRKAALLYMTECLCISVPCYCAGFGIFKLLLHSVFSKQFSFINEAYSFEIYMAIFALFTATLIVFLIILITRHVNQSVVNAWKENK